MAIAILVIISIILIVFIRLIFIVNKQTNILYEFYDSQNIKNKKMYDYINQIKQDLYNILNIIMSNTNLNVKLQETIDKHIDYIFQDTSSIRTILIDGMDINNDEICVEDERCLDEIVQQNIKQLITEISNYLNTKTTTQQKKTQK